MSHGCFLFPRTNPLLILSVILDYLLSCIQYLHIFYIFYIMRIIHLNNSLRIPAISDTYGFSNLLIFLAYIRVEHSMFVSVWIPVCKVFFLNLRITECDFSFKSASKVFHFINKISSLCVNYVWFNFPLLIWLIEFVIVQIYTG